MRRVFVCGIGMILIVLLLNEKAVAHGPYYYSQPTVRYVRPVYTAPVYYQRPATRVVLRYDPYTGRYVRVLVPTYSRQTYVAPTYTAPRYYSGY